MEKLSYLKSEYKGGKVSRRQFMEGALALGMTVATASAFVSEVQAMTPKKGGNMKFGIGAGSTTDSLDPGTTSDTYMQLTNYGLRGHLTEIGKDGKIQGDVAESYEASADAKTWTFKLRKGIEFHSGKSLEAEDVVASFNHHRGEETKSAAKGVLASVDDIKADGKDTVVFSLKEGSADFPYAASDYHITILPSKDGKVMWEKGEGSGAYVLESYEPGVKTVMKRNPNYWKEGAGNFDSVEILAIKDVVARTNALTSGEIHAMDRCDLKTVHLLKRNQALRVEQETGTQHYSIPMITTTA
ncbi:MAG: ABC transporter substrate-binding protein, partial [Pseudomonadota bacterium]